MNEKHDVYFNFSQQVQYKFVFIANLNKQFHSAIILGNYLEKEYGASSLPMPR